MRFQPVLFLAASLLACAAPPTSEANDARTVREAITREIGAATCTQHAQCVTLPLGHKACGGPESYVAWSRAASDAAKLQALAQSHAELRRTEVERSGLVSNCMVTPDPGAQCVANRCVLRERATLLR